MPPSAEGAARMGRNPATGDVSKGCATERLLNGQNIGDNQTAWSTPDAGHATHTIRAVRSRRLMTTARITVAGTD
jgi:hypothetical protein